MGLFSNLTSAIFDSPSEKLAKQQEKARFEKVLDTFLADSEIRYGLLNKASPLEKPHQLYRFVFRRCRVIGYLLKINEKVGTNISLVDIQAIEHYATQEYYKHVPETLYGKRLLGVSMPMINKLERLEKLTTKELANSKGSNELSIGRIYLGRCFKGRIYIGQTKRSPEFRYKEHRDNGTGPYKEPNLDVEWKVVKSCKIDELDYWESYYIGLHNAHAEGYNDNCGNNLDAYKLGISESEMREANKHLI